MKRCCAQRIADFPGQSIEGQLDMDGRTQICLTGCLGNMIDTETCIN